MVVLSGWWFLIKFKTLVIFLLLGIIIVGTARGIFTRNVTFISGEDCYSEHQRLYVGITTGIEYQDAIPRNSAIKLFISFRSTKSIHVKFALNTTLVISNTSQVLQLVNGSITVSKTGMTSKAFDAEWYINASEYGYYPVVVSTDISITAPGEHLGYTGRYNLKYYGGITVSQEAKEIPGFLVKESFFSLLESNIDWLLLSQLLGYVSFLFLWLAALAGPVKSRRVISRLTGKKIRLMSLVHCYSGYIALVSAVIHVILLELTTKWEMIANPVDLFVFSLKYDSVTGMNTGLDAGRFCLYLMTVITVSGYFFSRLVQKMGRRMALLTQQLSYPVILVIIFHAMVNGSLARIFPILLPMMAFMILTVLAVQSYYYFPVKKQQERL